MHSKAKTNTTLFSPENVCGLETSAVAISKAMIHPPSGVLPCLHMFCNAARLYNSVAARSESLLIFQLVYDRGGANPSNNDFPLSPLGLAGHRLISRSDPFLPPLCLCIHFHCVFDLLHYLLVLQHRGEEH